MPRCSRSPPWCVWWWRAASWARHPKAVLYGVCVLLAFSVAPASHRVQHRDRLFRIPQAKRLVPLVGAAGTVGFRICGWRCGSRVLVHPFGTGSLSDRWPVSCAAAALPLVPLLSKSGRRPWPRRKTRRSQPRWLGLADAIRDARRDFSWCVFSSCTRCSAASRRSSSISPSRRRSKNTTSTSKMAVFLGSFSVASNALVLVAQLFVTHRVMARFGSARERSRRCPRRWSRSEPSAALAPSLASASGAKLVESATRLSLGGAVSDRLAAPTAARVRARRQGDCQGRGPFRSPR